MNTDILLDLQWSINKGIEWPDSNFLKIRGCKYDMNIRFENIYLLQFDFQIVDPDGYPISNLDGCLFRDWIVENVIPNYLNQN